MGYDPQRLGLNTIYCPPNPTVDIVAVHGLNGHAFKTWLTKPSKNDKSAPVFWLGDSHMLPAEVPDARILTFGYDANVTSFLGSTCSDRVLDHAQTLVTGLAADRQNAGAAERPLVFVCHSLGGIIVKSALAYSNNRTTSTTSHLHSIYASTYGIVFFGTPHHGSSLANIASYAQRVLGAVVPSRIVDTNGQLLSALRQGSNVLEQVTVDFAPLTRRFKVNFFWEQKKTKLPHKWEYVVPKESAAPIIDGTVPCGLPYDHQSMCRFESPNSPGYRSVVCILKEYVKEAPSLIWFRWGNTKAMLKVRRMEEAAELIAPYGADSFQMK